MAALGKVHRPDWWGRYCSQIGYSGIGMNGHLIGCCENQVSHVKKIFTVIASAPYAVQGNNDSPVPKVQDTCMTFTGLTGNKRNKNKKHVGRGGVKRWGWVHRRAVGDMKDRIVWLDTVELGLDTAVQMDIVGRDCSPESYWGGGSCVYWCNDNCSWVLFVFNYVWGDWSIEINQLHTSIDSAFGFLSLQPPVLRREETMI